MSSDRDKIINMIGRLTEPTDMCKQLAYCSYSMYDEYNGMYGVNINAMGGMGPPNTGFNNRWSQFGGGV